MEQVKKQVNALEEVLTFAKQKANSDPEGMDWILYNLKENFATLEAALEVKKKEVARIEASAKIPVSDYNTVLIHGNNLPAGHTGE